MLDNMGEGARGLRRAEPAPGNQPRPAARRHLPAALVVLVAAVAGIVPAAYGLAGRPWQAFNAGLLLSGVLAMASGLVVFALWLINRQNRTSGLFRPLMSLAVLCWGIGQLILAVDSLDHVISYPALGDVIGSAAAPIALLAMICLPGRSTSAWSGLRLGLDSLVVGCALTFVLWRTVLVEPDGVLDAAQIGSGAFVLADCVIFAGVLLVGVRDVRSRIWPAVLGVGCHVVADLTIILSVTDSAPRLDPWLAMTLWCLAWPLIGLGVVQFRPTTPYRGETSQARREVVAGQVASVTMYVALLASVLIGGSVADVGAASKGTLVIELLIVPMMLARELIGTALRLRLIDGLRAEAYRDSLTGLPNRRALINRIAELDGQVRPWVVLTLDLDGFKQVNDLLGHEAGDRLLVTVADALSAHHPPGALAARIGGDEFAILTPGDLTEGRQLGERLRAVIGHELELAAPGLDTSVSVGVGRLVHPGERTDASPTEWPERSHAIDGTEHQDQLTGLVESAAALRAAKEGGRDAVEVYAGQVAADRERRLLLEHRLRLAIDNRTIVTYGQPIVDLGSGRLTGFESLARWTDEELGVVPPDEFIAVAEATGLVVVLGEYLLQETLAAASGAGAFAAGLTLSINASPIQLRVPGFVELIRYHLTLCKVPPRQVIVEITEAILVAEGDPAVSALAELSALGVGLAIDDFGTGYSALSYLRRLPVQVMKVDKSLTSKLLSEAKTVAIVEGVVRMAHRMGVRVTMEGIETELEADSCRAVGADQGQGYLFGRPMPWDAAKELIRNSARPPRESGPPMIPMQPAKSGRRPAAAAAHAPAAGTGDPSAPDDPPNATPSLP
jgi:diguanylate cyclase